MCDKGSAKSRQKTVPFCTGTWQRPPRLLDSWPMYTVWIYQRDFRLHDIGHRRFLTAAIVITWQVTLHFRGYDRHNRTLQSIRAHHNSELIKLYHTSQNDMRIFPHRCKYLRGQIRLKWVEDENFPSPWNWLEICTLIYSTFTWYRQMAWRSSQILVEKSP